MIDPSLADIEINAAPTIRPGARIADAADALRCPDAPAVVVLDEGAPVGIVTESDVVAMVAETEQRPPVRSVMSAPVVTIPMTGTVIEAAERMQSRGVRQLPVVDDGTYRGLVSATALAPYLSRRRFDIEWSGEPLSLADRTDGSLTVGNREGSP